MGDKFMFGLTKLLTWRPSKHHIESTYELEQLPVVPAVPTKPQKTIRVRQCGKILYMSEEQYKEYVKNYEQFRELLMKLCHGDCEDCYQREILFHRDHYDCNIMRYFDPERNLREEPDE